MHTVTGTIHQQGNAIKQQLNDFSERLTQQLERTTRRLIVRMALIVTAANAVFFIAYKFA
jgi:hypothetical protein